MDRRANGQLDIFGHAHDRRAAVPRKSWQPGLFTAEHEARANAVAWEAALERFRQLGRGGDERPTDDRG